MTIQVAHDITCPWCWIAVSQVRRMEREFGVDVEWIGYEMWPEELGWPPAGSAVAQVATNRPKTPRRLDLAYAAEGMERPTAERPKQMRIHNALEAIEYAKTEGVAKPLIERLYEAYWLEGAAVGELDVIENVAQRIVRDIPEMIRAIEERRFASAIVPFDDEAYARGVYNVPTFFINGERYAEQPYMVLAKALRETVALR